MKKLLAVLVALSMLLLFAGCGGTDDTNPDNTTTAATTTTSTGNSQNSEQPPKGFLEIFTSGLYHMKAKAAGGELTETFAKDGMKASLTEVDGIPSRTVLRDGKMHIVTDRRRIVLTTDKLNSAPTDVGTAVAAAAASPLGEGTAVFAGKNLPYEEYGTADSKVQCFLEDGKLVGVRSISKGKPVDTEIFLLDQDVPAGKFDIPDYYKQLST